jgi:hypothetical protein
MGRWPARGYYCREIAEALLSVGMEFNPTTHRSFLFGAFSLESERDKEIPVPSTSTISPPNVGRLVPGGDPRPQHFRGVRMLTTLSHTCELDFTGHLW